ncbi:hypothetical protein [Frankia sp. Cppng1_Ct_nod]|uniref:DUF7144 family membrane protein n=1 Tax=Frankia sp. Cppng1_Ct_nod TaxID=2897162 RepID=UPI0010411EAC|nr:hypothetical protein [Frankia sp. Cppng1_Ct_nod]
MEPVRSVRAGGGWLVFAAVIIFIAGFHNLIYGIAALRNYSYLVTSSGTVIYQDLDFWGWLLVCMGIVEIVTAAAILTGKQWARWLAIVICGLNAIAQLAFLAVFPVWSVVLIALDVAVIYGLTRHDAPIRGSYDPYPETDRPRARAERPEYSEASRSSRSGPDVSARG